MCSNHKQVLISLRKGSCLWLICWSRNKSARPEASSYQLTFRPKPKGTARHNKEYLIFSCGKKKVFLVKTHIVPWRIHGTGILTYMKTININHSWIGKYTSVPWMVWVWWLNFPGNYMTYPTFESLIFLYFLSGSKGFLVPGRVSYQPGRYQPWANARNSACVSVLL